MRRILYIFVVFLLMILQISFLSQLPSPFSDISFPLLGIALATFTDKPIRGVLWAVLGGILLDMHGIAPFGAELFVLLSIFFLTRLLFQRFITNASLPAAFLLSAVIILMHGGLLLVVDGIRVLLGAEPYIITQDASFGAALARVIFVNGSIMIAILAIWKTLAQRITHQFFIKK